MWRKPTTSPVPPPPPPPARPDISGHQDGVVQAGSTYALTLSATTYNDATPAWNLDAGPSGATITATNGTALVEWEPAADAEQRAYPFTVSASDGVRSRAVSWSVEVLAPGEAVLAAQELTLPDAVNLTELNYDDWAYFGPGYLSTGDVPIARKAGVDPALIGAPSFLVEPVWGYLSNTGRKPFAWTDGAPEAVASLSDFKGSWIRRAGGQANRGISIDVTGDPSAERQVFLYFGTLSDANSPTNARMTLSCPGADDVVQTFSSAGGTGFVERLYQIRFKPSEAGNLTIQYENTLTTGGLTLRAIGVKEATVPTLSASETIPFAVTVGQEFTTEIAYSGDEDVTITASPLPGGASLSGTSDNAATLTYTPVAGDLTSPPGPTVFRAMDGALARASLTAEYAVSAAAGGAAPVITIPSTTWSLVVGTNATQTITAAASGGASIASLTASGLPATAMFNNATGVLEWQPTAAGGPFTITITATDTLNRTSTATITANVAATAGGSLVQTSTDEYDAVSNRQEVNMTSVGTVTWYHVTKTTATPPVLRENIRSGGDADTFHTLYTDAAQWSRSNGDPVWPARWTNGSPDGSAAPNNFALTASADGARARIKPMIGTNTRTVTLYIGYRATEVTVKARSSHNDAAVLPDQTFGATDVGRKQRKIVYTITGIDAAERLILDVIKKGATGQVFVTGVTVA